MFIISRHDEPFLWISAYTQNYVVYNKGDPIYNNTKIINKPNIGGNQRDIFEFIYENYFNIPDRMVFLQAYPFDHCKKEKFDKIIHNKDFTSLESYEDNPPIGWHRKDLDGGYMEINNSWYLYHHGDMSYPLRYTSFDNFMLKYFRNYVHLDWLRFSPGSQYILPKKNALYYSRKFWKSVMDDLPIKNPREGHLIERALFLILTNRYQLRREFE